jgi:threonine/homoserine/homoserine lactone efflux protein
LDPSVSIALLLTTLVVVDTPGIGAVYSIVAGLSRGSRADIIAAFGMPAKLSSECP